MLAFLIVSTIVVFFISWILFACDRWTSGGEAFVGGIGVGVRWFFFVGIVCVIIKVITL